MLTNTSSHQIWIYVDKNRAAELEGYLIEVRDSQGQLQHTSHYYWSLAQDGAAKAPKGSEGDYSDNRREGPDSGSGGKVNPEPNGSNESRFDVNKLYAPLAPGKYTIQVQRTDEETKTEVKSNVITIDMYK